MGRRLAALSASFLLLAGGARLAGADASRAPLARTPGAVVLRWTQVLSGIGEVDRGPSLEVHRDGTVVVHYPRYMKKAGTWTMHLEPGELDALVQSIASGGAVDFDPAVARAEQQAAETLGRAAARHGLDAPDVVEVHDAATTRLEVDLRRVAPSGRAGKVGVAKTIEWYALAADAARYPEAHSIQQLAAAERSLKRLLRRPELVRIGEPER